MTLCDFDGQVWRADEVSPMLSAAYGELLYEGRVGGNRPDHGTIERFSFNESWPAAPNSRQAAFHGLPK